MKFVTLKTTPLDVDLMTACYMAWLRLHEKAEFTLTLESGEVMMSLGLDEFYIHEDFQQPFKLFDEIIRVEKQKSSVEMLEALERQALMQRQAAQMVQAPPQGAEEQPTIDAPEPDLQQDVPQEQRGNPRAAEADDIRSLLVAPSERQLPESTRRRR
jgi:hypothetical protein